MTTLQTLAIGYQGPAVKKLQRALNLMPYGHVTIREDGIFGAETAGAVQQLQSLAGISADGIVGPRTWDAIEHWAGMSLDISTADFAATTRPSNTPTPAPTDTAPSSGARGPLIAVAGALGLWGIYEWLTGRPKKR